LKISETRKIRVKLNEIHSHVTTASFRVMVRIPRRQLRERRGNLPPIRQEQRENREDRDERDRPVQMPYSRDTNDV
jgi:hypothetical protein